MNKNKITYPDKSGFGIEKNYFENFEARLKTRIELEEKILLNNRLKHAGMKVPVAYFDELEKNLLEKATTSKTTMAINWRLVINWASAAVILLGLTSYFFTQLPTANAEKIQFNLSDVSNETLESYIEESLFGSDLEYYLNENAAYDFVASFDADINAEAYLNYIEDELIEEDF